MDKYHIIFRGRKKGAIGYSERQEVTVEAEDFEQAQLRLYDNYEHVAFPIIERVKEDETT